MMILLLSSIYVVIILFQVPSMLKNKKYKELIIYFAIMLTAFVYSSLAIYGIKAFNPADLIKSITLYISKDFIKLLEE